MFSLTLMSKGEKRSGLDRMLQLEVQTDYSSHSGLPLMPKGEIVGMLTSRVCLSLMARSECAAMAKHEQRKLRRISAESHTMCRFSWIQQRSDPTLGSNTRDLSSIYALDLSEFRSDGHQEFSMGSNDNYCFSSGVYTSS